MKTCRDCIHGDVCPHEVLPTDIYPSYIDFSVRDDVENCEKYKRKEESKLNTLVSGLFGSFCGF